MKPRRQSSARLPPIPLELSYPLEVRGGGVEGAAILDELPPRSAPLVLKTLRLVHAWSRGPDAAGPILRRKQLEAFEREVVAAGLEDGLWEPLIAIVAELRRPELTKPDTLGRGCFALSEWALGAGAESTALLFAEAAALAWPEHARFAWMVGRMLRNHGRFREAELWLKRAARVAVWCADWETQNLALNSLGNLHAQQGSYPEALHYLTKAQRLAKREKLKSREAAVTHDLFMVSVFRGEHMKAERLAVSTFKLYSADHPNLPKLAHDVAYFWNEQGRFEAALPVLQALLRLLRAPEERLRVLAAAARAAGACGERIVFERVWLEAWEVLHDETAAVNAVLPPVLVDLGLGAASLSEWSRASEAFSRAVDAGRTRGMHDTVTRAEMALDMVRRRERIEQIRAVGKRGPAAQLSDAFVRSLERVTLGPQNVICNGTA